MNALYLMSVMCEVPHCVCQGTVVLPRREDMWRDIRGKREAMAARYVESPRHTIQVDWIPFMDELATQLGCKPDFCE
jgi:dimethylaniline monooxygenase (N-oxide forming)